MSHFSIQNVCANRHHNIRRAVRRSFRRLVFKFGETPRESLYFAPIQKSSPLVLPGIETIDVTAVGDGIRNPLSKKALGSFSLA